MTDEVILRRVGVVGWITVDRPAARNALTTDVVKAIAGALDAWQVDDGVEAIVIDGAGPHGLCAGGDLRAMHASAVARDDRVLEFFWHEYRMNARIARYAKPVITIMDGLVMGGGVGLSAHASIRLVTDRTRLAMPEVVIGLAPDVGATWLLSRAPGQAGAFLGLTATSVTGADAIWCGLADRFVPERNLEALRNGLRGCLGLAEVVAVIDEHAEPAPDSELATQATWIDECFAHDDPLSVVGALRSHPHAPAREWASAIERQSPTAVWVTLAALRRAARASSLEAALEQEYRTSGNLVALPDFAEGVRALIIDKDRQPRWTPDSLADVDPAQVQRVLDAEVGDGLGLAGR